MYTKLYDENSMEETPLVDEQKLIDTINQFYESNSAIDPRELHYYISMLSSNRHLDSLLGL